MKAILFIFLSSPMALLSCTNIELRTYSVEPVPELPVHQVARVFATFRQYIALLGYEPKGPEALSNAQLASFIISGPSSGEDLVIIWYEGGRTFGIQLQRYLLDGQGISIDEEAAFVEMMVTYISDSTNTPVNLHLIDHPRIKLLTSQPNQPLQQTRFAGS